MLAISRSRNSKIGGKWNAARNNGARMMKPGRHPLPCVYRARWSAPRALASIFAPPNFAFLECKFYRNERIARNEGGCGGRPIRKSPSLSSLPSLHKFPSLSPLLSHDKFGGKRSRKSNEKFHFSSPRGRKELSTRTKVEERSGKITRGFDFFSFASILLFRREVRDSFSFEIEDSCLNYSAWTWLKKRGHTLLRSGKKVRMRTMRGIEWGSKEGRVRHNDTRTNDTVDKLITRNSGTTDSRIALFR